jgi:hypothetical protein
MVENEKQIDAVITWLDGSDLQHREKRQKTLEQESGKQENELTTGRDKTRFIDNGELKYCISSIKKFAPWIRKIHLVTDNQTPDFLTPELQKNLNIDIVDHKDIFKSHEWALPTFNSRTIETALWRIPGLASRFIYFNDDFIITKPVTPDDFFRDEKVVLRGKWNSIREYGPLRMKLNQWFSFAVKKFLGITRSMHLLLQIRSAQLAGFSDKYFRAPHVPHPIRTDTLSRYYAEHPTQFKENIKYRFRNTDQFSSIYLANHLEIKKNQAEFKPPDDFMMINGETDFSIMINRKLKKITNSDVKFVCVQGFEKFEEKHRKNIHRAFKNLLDMNDLKTDLSNYSKI